MNDKHPFFIAILLLTLALPIFITACSQTSQVPTQIPIINATAPTLSPTETNPPQTIQFSPPIFDLEPTVKKTVTSRRIFTWISHPINDSTSRWLSELGFTDVAVRYINETEFQTSKQVLSRYGINIWRFLNPTEAFNNLSCGDFPTEPTLIDDLHLLGSNERAVLVSKASLSSTPLLLTVYCENLTGTLAGLDLSNVDVDLYGRPTDIKLEDLQWLKANAHSVGVYLWIWKGHGFTWDTVTLEQVQHVYDLAEEAGASRFCVWMGSETDSHEQGMGESSLINHPEWYEIIRNLNMELTGIN